MDFDLGNILYVVITLVAIIASLLGKKKKPAKGGNIESVGEAQPGFMESLSQVFSIGDDHPQVMDANDYEKELVVNEYAAEQEKVQEPEYESILPAYSLMDDYDRIMASLNDEDSDLSLGDLSSHDDSLEVISLEKVGGADFFDIVNDFDAGKAIVYSAIINRLDY